MTGRSVIPQRQEFHHDPESGIHGDCYRTAVAVALGVSRSSVPHIYAHDDQEGGGGMDAMREWLAARGLAVFTARFDASAAIDNVLALSSESPGVPIVISGLSPRGYNHSVVALDGSIVCDPFDGSCNSDALIGPAKGDEGDAFWWIEVYSPIACVGGGQP